jgi:hypothetical protein
MNRTIKKLLFLLIIIPFQIHSQQTELKSAFVSANLGINIVAQDQFDKVYGSNLGFAIGASLGLPLSSCSYILGKFNYFSKNGTGLTDNYQLQDGHWVLVSEIPDGSAKFTEWILSGGFMYKFFLSETYTLSVDGGLDFVSSIAEGKSSDGSLSASVPAKGIGFFGGIICERNFGKSPFSIIGDVQYNSLYIPSFNSVRNDGRVGITLGLRYYFKDRRFL